jgi:4-carboxymuconolactone decarboxylase
MDMQKNPTINMDMVNDVSPGLMAFTQDAIVNDVWTRPGLAPRDRALATMSALITRQQTIGMPHYFNLALDRGITPQEISEVITHLAFYASWPHAFGALAIARDVFAQRGIAAASMPPAHPTLLEINESVEGVRAEAVSKMFGKQFPGVVQYTTDLVFRNLWVRPGLTPRDRSLVTVCSLIASGHVAQLTYHLNRGMDNGLMESEVAEVVTHLIFYVGWPTIFSAMPTIKEIFEARQESMD